MTLMQFGLSLASVLFFLAGTIGVVVPLWKRKSEKMLLIALSWGVSLMLLASVILAQVGAYFLGLPLITPELQYILLLTAGGVLVMPFLFKWTMKWQCLFLFIFCFLGTIGLPDVLFGVTDIWGVTGIRLLFAAIWMSLILTFVELDRVPVEGFVFSMGYFLLFLLMSTGMLNVLPDGLFDVCVQILTMLLFVLLIYKKYTFVWLGFPMVFALMFLASYLFCHLAVTPNGPYVLIILSYPFVEAFAAIGLNVYQNHRIFPVLVPLAAERALMAGVSLRTVILRIFYIILLTGILGVLGLRTNMQFFAVSLFMTVLIMYASYLRMVNNMPKVSLRSVKDDAKNGISALWQEIKTVPLKKPVQPEQSVTPTEASETKTDSDTPKAKKMVVRQKQQRESTAKKSVRKTTSRSVKRTK